MSASSDDFFASGDESSSRTKSPSESIIRPVSAHESGGDVHAAHRFRHDAECSAGLLRDASLANEISLETIEQQLGAGSLKSCTIVKD